MAPGKVSAEMLKALPIFEALEEKRREVIAKFASAKQVPRGTVLVSAGDKTDHIYFILSGTLKVMISDEEGREVIFSTLGEGDFFGEMSVLDDSPRSATVTALTPCNLVMISKAEFNRCLTENHDIALFIIRSLVRRLRMADRKIESLALMDVYGRVARLLLEMAETGEDGRKVVLKKVSKQDIAKMVGASREMVSRVMRDLGQQGLIEEVDGSIWLNDLLETA